MIENSNKKSKSRVRFSGPQDHPGQEPINGTFNLLKHPLGYMLVFCDATSPTCSDIGRYDNGKGGRRLTLNDQDSFQLFLYEYSNKNYSHVISDNTI
ncbi:hypothetical protein CR513_26825, partial [Mucuna pruriens]